MSDEKLSEQVAYEAYAVSTGGQTWDGKPMPTWNELPYRIQAAWEAASNEVKKGWLSVVIDGTLIQPLITMNRALEVLEERGRQDAKWGVQDHAPLYWLGIIGEEFGEVAKELIEDDPKEARAELVQLAAVCLGALEAMDRAAARELEAMTSD